MEYLNGLYKEIIASARDTQDVIKKLDELSGNTIVIGAGGSKVVATFASLVLENKKNIFTKVVDVRDLKYIDKSKYDNIFIASYSGSNFGVKSSIEWSGNKYLLTTRKTKIKDEINLNYKMECENSFISLKSTIIPMSILLKYYLGDDFEECLKIIFSKVNDKLFLDVKGNYLNIFSGVDTKTAEVFLESSLAESGIAIPLIHEKYSYCHGRSTINKSHNESAIFLNYNGSELDNALLQTIDLQMPNNCILKKLFEDPIVNEFYLTLECLCLLKNIAKSKKIDLCNIKYDKEVVKNLYYFKGSM